MPTDQPDDPEAQRRVTHAVPGTPCDEDMPGLEQASRARMTGPPICLTAEPVLLWPGNCTPALRLPQRVTTSTYPREPASNVGTASQIC